MRINFQFFRLPTARLRRAADVTVVESAHLRHRNNGAVFGWLHGARLGRVFLERQMRTRAVIVAEVAAQTTTQVDLSRPGPLTTMVWHSDVE